MKPYADCAARGLTQAQTARELGVSRTAVCAAARKLGLTFALDPRANPGNATTRTGPLTAEHREAVSRGLREAWARSRRGLLGLLSDSEHRDYRFLQEQHHYNRADALRAIGRADLLAAPVAAE